MYNLKILFTMKIVVMLLKGKKVKVLKTFEHADPKIPFESRFFLSYGFCAK